MIAAVAVQLGNVLALLLAGVHHFAVAHIAGALLHALGKHVVQRDAHNKHAHKDTAYQAVKVHNHGRDRIDEAEHQHARKALRHGFPCVLSAEGAFQIGLFDRFHLGLFRRHILPSFPSRSKQPGFPWFF